MLGSQWILQIEYPVTRVAQKLKISRIKTLVTGYPAAAVNIDHGFVRLQIRIIGRHGIESLVAVRTIAKFLLFDPDLSLWKS
jgi:hypothetical protein